MNRNSPLKSIIFLVWLLTLKSIIFLVWLLKVQLIGLRFFHAFKEQIYSFDCMNRFFSNLRVCLERELIIITIVVWELYFINC